MGSARRGPAQEVAALAKKEGMQSIAAVIEHETVEIRGGLIRFGIPFPAVSVVTTHQQRPIAATGPNGTVIGPGHVHVAVAIGDRDNRFAPFLNTAVAVVETNLSAAGHHPEISIGLIADALQALAAYTLMDFPNRLSWLPGGVEIAKTTHAYIAAVAASA